jgi:hypothetical protein
MFQTNKTDNMLIKALERFDMTPNVDDNTFFKTIMSQTVLLCTISNDCMAPYWGPRGAYVMSYQANAILKT